MPEQDTSLLPAHMGSSNMGQKTSENLETDSLPILSSSQGTSTVQDGATASVTPSNATQSPTTSSLETMSSSPAAAAAQRAISRVVSMATMGGYETAEESADARKGGDAEEEGQTTPTRLSAPGTIETSPTPTKPKMPSMQAAGGLDEDADDEFQNRKTPKRRPKYLNSRMASQRSSYSSNTTSIDGPSERTISAEYALQSGGGLPLDNSFSSRSDRQLLRSISLGSVASGISKTSEAEEASRPSTARMSLDPLVENGSHQRPSTSNGLDSGAQTPRGPNPDTPTDTVINQRIRNLEVPGTVARKFQMEENDQSDRANGTSKGRAKDLTLKEQSSVIDKLQKDNWKLKLKLYFMDQMVAERSDESVKAMISENVELKTLKISTTKEIRVLKRTIRELELKLRERDERLAAQAATARNNIRSAGPTRDRSTDADGEVVFLRERLDTFQSEVERLRSDNAVKEGEKRRLAEMLKSTGERSTLGSDVEVREEIALWKDLLETETARKDQAEEENRRPRHLHLCLQINRPMDFQQVAKPQRMTSGATNHTALTWSSCGKRTQSSSVTSEPRRRCSPRVIVRRNAYTRRLRI